MRLRNVPVLLLLCALPTIRGAAQTAATGWPSPFADCPVQISFNFGAIRQLMLRAENIGLKTVNAFDVEVEFAPPRFVLLNETSKAEWHYFHLQKNLAAGEHKQIALEIYGSQQGIKSVRLSHIEFSDGSSISAICMGTPFGFRYLGTH